MSANRGKYSEGKVREFLKKWADTHLHFCFNRILDAHSARGAMANPQPGDFQWFMQLEPVVGDAFPRTRNGLIEVKEVEHAYRLPHKNFSVDQVGRMRVRQLAGSEPLVLVCFRPEGGETRWLAPEFEMFMQRDGGSWDFRGMPTTHRVDTILEEHFR